MKKAICLCLGVLLLLESLSQELEPFKSGSLWGFRNEMGEIKIIAQYQRVSKFRGDHALVSKKDKAGLIDKNNNILIPLIYDYLKPLDSSEFLFGFRTKYFGEYNLGVISKDGKIKIKPEFYYIEKRNNVYIVTKNNDTILKRTSSGDLRSHRSREGVINNEGQVIIPCKFMNVRWATDSLLVVDSSYLSADKKFLPKNSALFTIEGKQLTGFDYMVIADFKEGLAKGRIGDKYGFLNKRGQIAIPIKYEFCEDFSNGYSMIKQAGKWGAINRKGEIVIAPLFTYEEIKSSLKGKKEGAIF